MTGIRILQNRVNSLNEISKREFRLSSLGVDIGDNNTKYRRYTLRLLSSQGSHLILNDLSAKESLMIIESLIEFFLFDKENNPLLYVFA